LSPQGKTGAQREIFNLKEIGINLQNMEEEAKRFPSRLVREVAFSIIDSTLEPATWAARLLIWSKILPHSSVFEDFEGLIGGKRLYEVEHGVLISKARN